MNYFLFTGCWNKNKCVVDSDENGLSSVIQGMNEFVNVNQVDFIVMGGDNYYPIKKKGEQKMVNDAELVSGFTCLNAIKKDGNPVPTIVLFGNHDYDASLMVDLQQRQLQRCYVTEREKMMIQAFHFNQQKNGSPFPNVLIWNQSVMILLDSSMFEEDDVTCYHTYLTKQQLIIEQIRDIETRLRFISKSIDHIYVMGHHPILGKKKDEKVEFMKDEQFLDLFFRIYEILPVPITYLCADIHNFQNMNMSLHRRGESISLLQLIVGTGGTDQDEVGEDIVPETQFDLWKNYSMVVHNHAQLASFGFVTVSSTHHIRFHETKQALFKVKDRKEKKDKKEKLGRKSRSRRKNRK